MGIKDINNFLKKREFVYENISPIKEISGYRIAIDSCNWIYTFMPDAYKRYLNSSNFSIDEEVNHFYVFKNLLYDMIEFIILLGEKNITPIFVWDGKHPDDKSETKIKRREDREKRISKAAGLREEIIKVHPLKRDSKKIEEWKKIFMSSTRLPNKYFDEFRIFLKNCGIPSIQARADAEKLCCELNVSGFVVGVWSRDTDLYALNTLTMIVGINEYNFTYIQPQDIMKHLEMDSVKFRDFCIGCECDFNSRAKGIGPAKLYKLMSKVESIEEIISQDEKKWQCLNLEKCRKYLTPKLRKCYKKFKSNQHILNWDKNQFDENAKTYLESYQMKKFFKPLFNALSNISTVLNLFD